MICMNGCCWFCQVLALLSKLKNKTGREWETKEIRDDFIIILLCFGWKKGYDGWLVMVG